LAGAAKKKGQETALKEKKVQKKSSANASKGGGPLARKGEGGKHLIGKTIPPWGENESPLERELPGQEGKSSHTVETGGKKERGTFLLVEEPTGGLRDPFSVLIKSKSQKGGPKRVFQRPQKRGE